MTTIDITKLKRIITQCGSQDEMEMVRAIWNAAQAEEREECARICDEPLGLDQAMRHRSWWECSQAIRQK